MSMFLIFLFATAAAACPPSTDPRCACADVMGEREYQCESVTTKLLVTARVNKAVKIQCQEGVLSCPGMPHFPVSNNHTLGLLTLSSCSVSGSLGCVARALDAPAVERVHLEYPGEELSWAQLDGLRGVREIVLDHAEAQTSLPLDLFAKLPSLHAAIIRGSPVVLSNGPWPDDDHLNYLELHDVQILDLPDGAFKSLKNLTSLALTINRITSIHYSAFTGLNKLRHINLSGNPLRWLLDGAFRETPRLQTLKLIGNSLQLIRAGAVSGLPELESIHIFLNRKTLTLEPKSLSQLPSLLSVDISSSPLAPLPGDLFLGSAALVNLTMVDCKLTKLPETLFLGLINLEHLSLKENSLTSLEETQFWDLKQLKTLNLSENQLDALPVDIFAGLSHLESITLDGNRLTVIHEGTFNGPADSLKMLSIRDNQLTLLKGHIKDGLIASPFMPLVHLQNLDLSGNRISRVCDDWRITWGQAIRRIDLSRNKFKRLKAKDFAFFRKVTVDFRNNEIFTVEFEPEVNSTKATFLLDSNPFICDCNIYSFLNFVQQQNKQIIKMDEATCFAPKEFKGQLLKKIPLKDLTCAQTLCPENCTCVGRPSISTFELECLNPPDINSYPDPSIVKMSRTKLKLKNFKTLTKLPDHVYSLSLRGSNLYEIPEFPKTVQEIDLRYNPIPVIPDWVIERQISLFLPNNTLKCDCMNVDSVKKLYDNRFNIHDFEEIVCQDGRYLNKIDIDKMCDVFNAVVIGGTLATVGVIALLSAILIYRYARKIQTFIYKMGWDPYLHKLGIHIYEEDFDGKSYDALISYSDDTEKYIAQTFVPLILNEGYTVCVRYRDWDIGDWIPGKVDELTSKSRRVLVLASKKYSRESVAYLELESGLVRERSVRRRVVLMIETKEFDCHPDLKPLLESRKTLCFNDETFWERLKQQLPRKRKRRENDSEERSQKISNMQLTVKKGLMSSSKNSLTLERRTQSFDCNLHLTFE